MENSCTHEWSDEIETCRTCGGIHIEEAEIDTNSSSNNGKLRMKVEPLYGYFCEDCQDFTMISPALHCLLCGELDWINTMDEEIFGA